MTVKIPAAKVVCNDKPGQADKIDPDAAWNHREDKIVLLNMI
jgi:hypothetical protein